MGEGSEPVVEAAAARVTVSLPSKVWDALEQSAKTDCISKTEALRRAVWIYLYLMDRVRSRCEIIIERPDGNSERVVFPY
jgi:metal-responsive CopG/Arc/MetJ family transcriptional regulator